MSTFTVSLPSSLKPFLESEAAAEGLEPSAYLEAMLQRKQRRKELEAEIQADFEEIEQGKGIRATPEYWAKIACRILPTSWTAGGLTEATQRLWRIYVWRS